MKKIIKTYRQINLSFFIFIALSTALFDKAAHSHELQENRASLVLRNERQISITFYLNLSELMHKTIAPKQNRFELVAKLAATSEDDFLKNYDFTKKNTEGSVFFKHASGKKITAREWQWPDPKTAQKSMRELTMQTVVGSSSHVHENPIEVKLQIQSDVSLDSLLLELPSSMRPMTLVASRPKQTRFDLSAKEITIHF